jgi:hypothetical protein
MTIAANSRRVLCITSPFSSIMRVTIRPRRRQLPCLIAGPQVSAHFSPPTETVDWALAGPVGQHVQTTIVTAHPPNASSNDRTTAGVGRMTWPNGSCTPWRPSPRREIGARPLTGRHGKLHDGLKGGLFPSRLSELATGPALKFSARRTRRPRAIGASPGYCAARPGSLRRTGLRSPANRCEQASGAMASDERLALAAFIPIRLVSRVHLAARLACWRMALQSASAMAAIPLSPG